MALEFFIRSFLSWSLGLRETCFLACDVFEKSGYLYHCSFALILWLLLWGIFGCAELSFVCICCKGYLGGLLLYRAQITPALFFASWHGSGLLLTVFKKKSVFAESCMENSVLCEMQYLHLEGMGDIATMLQFLLSLFLQCLEKNLIVVVHLTKEYSSCSALFALSWWFWLAWQGKRTPNSIVGSEKPLLKCFTTKQHPVSRISEKGNLLSLQAKVQVQPGKPC